MDWIIQEGALGGWRVGPMLPFEIADLAKMTPETMPRVFVGDGEKLLLRRGLTPAQAVGTARHESIHVAHSWGIISDDEWGSLVTRYGGEERIAEAYRAWSGKQPDTIFEKIRSFFATIYEALFTPNQGDEFSTFGSVVGGRLGAVRDYRTADRVFGDMGSGEIWRRTPRLADEAGSAAWRRCTTWWMRHGTRRRRPVRC